MKQQVLYIHGGTVFSTREEYRSYLEKKTVTLDDLRPRGDWKSKLQDDLGERFEVLAAKMPNQQSASYVEWRIWFSKILPLLNDDVILIGHSLGGLFLAKYFTEEVGSKKAKALILVAAPFAGKTDEPLADFNFSDSIKNLDVRAGDVHIFISEDDPVVSVADAKKYKEAVPTATLHQLKGYGHFRSTTFPEIITLINSLL
jgi:predicted alpha/beta hydrolase family esterase